MTNYSIIRSGWSHLPDDKKCFLQENRLKIGFGFLLFCLSMGYYSINYLERTPMTKRKRLMSCDSKQVGIIKDLELKHLKENSDKFLPPDDPTVQRIAKVIKNILRANNNIERLGDKKLSFSVIDTEDENAYVNLSGHLFVQAGMLTVINCDEQLGFLICHELAHWVLNHGEEKVCVASLLNYILCATISTIWALVPHYTVPFLLHTFCIVCIEIFFIQHARMTELEADYVGLQLAAKACMDVRQSSLCLDRLDRLMATIRSIEETKYLSRHPSFEKRIKHLNAYMEEALKFRESCGCPTFRTGKK